MEGDDTAEKKMKMRVAREWVVTAAKLGIARNLLMEKLMNKTGGAAKVGAKNRA